jgi:predicted MPP superfamily phosphohydrolase
MHLVAIVWILGLGIGHTALLVFSVNWWYSFPLPSRFLSCLRLAHVALILLGWIAFTQAYFYADSLSYFFSPFAFGSGFGQVAGRAYALVCGLIGLGYVPLLTIRRLLRGQPAALLSNHTSTVDVASRLGYKPIGRGKYRILAHLPGNEVFRVDFAERSLELPGLPSAWDGLTILHLSDLHFCGTPDRAFYQQVMDQCCAWQPDLVAITGDIVDSDYHHRWIVPILGRLRWRVAAFGILGNHDARREPTLVRRRLRRVGVRVLANCWEKLTVRDEPLVIIGHEGPWFRPGPDLSTCPRGTFRLCLSHTPDNLGWARQQEVHLMLAGHNHGGQIRFPVIGSVIVPSYYGRRYDCGMFHEAPTLLHVSRGLAGKEPVRYNCRPEAALLVLRCKKAADPLRII